MADHDADASDASLIVCRDFDAPPPRHRTHCGDLAVAVRCALHPSRELKSVGIIISFPE
jgi:hypothetical protein